MLRKIFSFAIISAAIFFTANFTANTAEAAAVRRFRPDSDDVTGAGVEQLDEEINRRLAKE